MVERIKVTCILPMAVTISQAICDTARDLIGQIDTHSLSILAGSTSLAAFFCNGFDQ